MVDIELKVHVDAIESALIASTTSVAAFLDEHDGNVCGNPCKLITHLGMELLKASLKAFTDFGNELLLALKVAGGCATLTKDNHKNVSSSECGNYFTGNEGFVNPSIVAALKATLINLVKLVSFHFLTKLIKLIHEAFDFFIVTIVLCLCKLLRKLTHLCSEFNVFH
jgi:hypothetical protein